MVTPYENFLTHYIKTNNQPADFSHATILVEVQKIRTSFRIQFSTLQICMQKNIECDKTVAVALQIVKGR